VDEEEQVGWQTNEWAGHKTITKSIQVAQKKGRLAKKGEARFLWDSTMSAHKDS
jgi:hypothetical protein